MESEGATTTLSFLAGALTEIAKCIGSAVSSWQMQLAIPNASPDLKRQYYDAIVKRQLQLMMMEDTSSSSTEIPHQIDLQTPSSQTSAAKTTTKFSCTSTESNNADNCDDDDDFSKVPGTILPSRFSD
jgi:Tfp pilus assembly protein PilW